MKTVLRELCVQAACTLADCRVPFPQQLLSPKYTGEGLCESCKFQELPEICKFVYSSYLIFSFLNLNNPTSRKECFCLKKIASKDYGAHTNSQCKNTMKGRTREEEISLLIFCLYIYWSLQFVK